MKTTYSTIPFLMLAATALPAKAAEPADSIPSYEELEDIIVTADAPMIKSDGATTTYDVSLDPSAATLTVLDLLRKVPMVSVDAQDKIRLNGQEDYRIYINGHEDAALSANASTIFKMMPASTVAKVEVITEPGAKFDAEGTSGIINIIMAQSAGAGQGKSDGIAGNISTSVSNREVTPSGMLRFKKRNVTASINAAYSNSLEKQTNISHSLTRYTDPDPIACLQEETRQAIDFKYWMAGANASWEPNTRNLFTVNFNISHLGAKGNNLRSDSEAFNADGASLFKTSRDIGVVLGQMSLSAQASYRHNFNNTGHNLIISYLYSFGRNLLQAAQTYEQKLNYPIGYDYLFQRNLTFDRSHTLQADYAIPFSEKHKLETGAKAILRRNSSWGNTLAGEDESSASSSADPTSLRQHQDIGAIYALYTGVFGQLSANGGLRYEHTRMHMSDATDATYRFTTRLNDIVPNAALTWSFSPMHNIRLAYQMRISRPTIEQVNPFAFNLDINSVRLGNPDLDCQHQNRVSLTYTQFGRTIGGNISIDYSRTDNLITSWTYLEGGILHDTYANLGHKDETGINGFLNWAFTKDMTLRISGRAAYVAFSAPEANIKRHGITGNYNINYDCTMPWRMKLSAFGGQGFRDINPQGYWGGWHYYGISLSRNFLADDALTLTLSASGFADPWIRTAGYTNTTKTIQHNSFSMRQIRYGLSLSWNFGSFHGNVKETGANLDAGDEVTIGKRGGI